MQMATARIDSQRSPLRAESGRAVKLVLSISPPLGFRIELPSEKAFVNSGAAARFFFARGCSNCSIQQTRDVSVRRRLTPTDAPARPNGKALEPSVPGIMTPLLRLVKAGYALKME